MAWMWSHTCVLLLGFCTVLVYTLECSDSGDCATPEEYCDTRVLWECQPCRDICAPQYRDSHEQCRRWCPNYPRPGAATPAQPPGPIPEVKRTEVPTTSSAVLASTTPVYYATLKPSVDSRPHAPITGALLAPRDKSLPLPYIIGLVLLVGLLVVSIIINIYCFCTRKTRPKTPTHGVQEFGGAEAGLLKQSDVETQVHTDTAGPRRPRKSHDSGCELHV